MKVVQRSKAVNSAQKFFWIGTALALFYWFLESLIHVAVFEGGEFFDHLFPPDAHEIWKRLFVIALMILFSIYAQRSINTRRRTEAALAEREKELSRIFENNPAAIMLIDAASRKVTWVNSNAAKLIGSPKEAIENQICHQHLCQRESGFCPILDSGMQSVDFSEQVLTTAGGDQVPIIKSITRVNYNGKEHFLETFFDLSNYKKMERDLKQAHAELDQIFQTASVAMRLVDKKFNVLKINNTFERLTAISEADAIGKKCYEIFSGPTCYTEECPIQRISKGMQTVESYVDKTRTDGKSIP
ncbi:MAG TPA: PAS domain-containing protein, partial [Methylomicrobium sp.]|nr:PAS domain-containing protein [Methylomicrobium sp.]